MNPHSSAFLAAFLLLTSAVSRAMPADGVEALAQQLRDDGRAREVAGAHLESFLLQPDTAGKSFVGADADRAALGALARAWVASAKADDLAVLLVVSTPKSKTEARLRESLKSWTESAQIQKTKEKASAGAFFADAAQKAALIFSDNRARREIDEAIEANEGSGVPVPGGAAAIERARRLREKQGAGNAAIFGRDREAQDLQGGGNARASLAAAAQGGRDGRKTPEAMVALITDLNAAHRAGRGEPRGPAIGSNAPPPPSSVPGLLGPDAPPGEFQALGSVEVAPAPGLMDRSSSLATSDAPTIAADLKQIRDSLKDAELPAIQGLTDSNPAAIKEFFEWLRSAKESDMPAIDYTILPKGEVGSYAPGIGVSKGNIKVNHFIRNEPAHARASVVVHELYHYWDKRIARNLYPNVSYGYIDPASKHIHEYDAYLATSLYWQMVKKEGDSSALARLLDRIPTDPGQVQEMVDGVVGGRK